MITDTPIIYENSINNTFIFNPSTYIPTIETKDYDVGYIDRFFVGKLNESSFIETNNRDYNSTDSILYKKIKIKWKITGPEFNVYERNILQYVGVVNYNKLRILEVDKVFLSAPLILNNPKQFWRGY
jgi:hypothetical protein